MRKKLSQEPVPTAMPLSVTPKQLTLLSWPAKIPETQTKHQSNMLHDTVLRDLFDSVCAP